MKAILAAALLLLAQAGNAATPSLPDTNFIYVVGNAEMEFPPDQCTITLEVMGEGSTAERAAEQLRMRSAAVAAAAQRAGLGPGAIDGHALVKSVPYSDKPGRKPEFTRHFTIKVLDLKASTALADRLIAMEGVKSLEMKFDVADTRATSLTLTEKAAADAQDKAARLAASFVRKLGRVTAISEEGMAQMQSRFGLLDARSQLSPAFQVSSSEGAVKSYEVPRTVSYSRELYVIFSLE